MKTILIYFLLIVSTIAKSQSATILPSNSITNNKVVSSSGLGFQHKSTLGDVIFETKVNSTNAVFQTKTDHPLNFAIGISTRMQVESGGDVLLGDWVKFGSDAPKINMKEFTINTANTDGGDVSLLHGLNPSYIISLKAIVDLGPAGNVTEEYKVSNGYQISLSFENNYIYVWNKPGNSNNILNKPCRILVTYGIN
jgi:hypothetical protein